MSNFANADEASPLPEDCDRVGRMVERWLGHMKAGRWQLSVPLETPLGPDSSASDALRWAAFWTEASDFHAMPSELVADLRKSSLVVFKGDLNMCIRSSRSADGAGASCLATGAGPKIRRSPKRSARSPANSTCSRCGRARRTSSRGSSRARRPS